MHLDTEKILSAPLYILLGHTAHHDSYTAYCIMLAASCFMSATPNISGHNTRIMSAKLHMHATNALWAKKCLFAVTLYSIKNKGWNIVFFKTVQNCLIIIYCDAIFILRLNFRDFILVGGWIRPNACQKILLWSCFIKNWYIFYCPEPNEENSSLFFDHSLRITWNVN